MVRGFSNLPALPIKQSAVLNQNDKLLVNICFPSTIGCCKSMTMAFRFIPAVVEA